MIEYKWTVAVEAGDSAAEAHTVTARLSRLAGKLTVSIDGDSFTLPAGLFGLRAARREIFRLGDEQAVLCVERGGKMSLLLRGEAVEPDTVMKSASPMRGE